MKKGYYYMVLTYKLPDGTPTSKWRPTGLKVRGNKIRAEEMLWEYRQNFIPPEWEHVKKHKGTNESDCQREEGEVPTVEEYLLNYMQSRKNNVWGTTWETRMKFAKHIIRGLGSYKVTELNKNIAMEFLNEFAATPYIKNKKGDKEYYAQDTINKVSDLLKNIVDELLDEEYLQKDIMAKVKRPRSRKLPGKKNQALGNKEIKYIFHLVKDDLMLKVILNMFLFLGLRPGELWALEKTDIDWEEKTIYIGKALSIDPIYNESGDKVGKKVVIKRLKNDTDDNFALRTLKLPPQLEELLREWFQYLNMNTKLKELKELKGTSSYIFCNVKNGELAEPQYYLRRYKYLLKKHGHSYHEFNYYRFRHTFATNALRQGLDIKSVQMMLGDNDPEMVLRIYANLQKKEILDAHERFTKQYSEELAGAAV